MRGLLVGGLGSPHDDLVAAALAAEGHDARTLGRLDDDALDRGRAALPRGQCAPLLYTTGALLRAAAREGTTAYLGIGSCGPCRYALFEDAWRRALGAASLGHVGIVLADLSPAEVHGLLGASASTRLIAALLAADALAELERRLRPHLRDPGALDPVALAARARVAGRIAGGASPIAALAAERGFHRGLPLAPVRPLARAVIVGEPWSLHAAGDAQLHLPELLARAGVEVEVPPLALFIAYRLFQIASGEPWGARAPTAAESALARAFEGRVRAGLRAAGAALGLGPLVLPSIPRLAALGAAELPPAFRGGYGPLEVALALRARDERRAHCVLSVKSFGCIPSSGVSDGIIPAALGGALPFLALEVSGDGEAARESRLMLRIAAAVETAEEELGRACAVRGIGRAAALRSVVDPLAAPVGPRPYACSLASALLEPAPGRNLS